MGLSLAQALRLRPRSPHRSTAVSRPGKAIAFVGAGGKTTAIFALARELSRPPLITTTTHLGSWQIQDADRHVVVQSVSELKDLDTRGVALLTGPPTMDDRLSGVGPAVLEGLFALAHDAGRDLLIEADGSRSKPLKAPGPNEPVIPTFIDCVVVLAGLAGLGMPLDQENVHRPESFAAITGLQLGDEVTDAAMVQLLIDRNGGLKGIPVGARRVALLNQADSDQLQARAHSMVAALINAYDTVIISSVGSARVHAAYEPCAGIVLAGGGASRFGGPKQVVQLQGQPLVRIAARSALAAGLDPVVVVTGAFPEQVRGALDGLRVVVIHNEAWQEGQASSVRAGLAAIPAAAGSAVFLLADQPFVGADVIQALVRAHATEPASIVAPLLEESRRANPVLFDRETFNHLLQLKGDTGGRSIFPEFAIHYVPWHDAAIAQDIDTPDDYRTLLEQDR